MSVPYKMKLSPSFNAQINTSIRKTFYNIYQVRLSEQFWTPPPPINFIHDEIRISIYLLLFRVRLGHFLGRALRLGQARGPTAAATGYG